MIATLLLATTITFNLPTFSQGRSGPCVVDSAAPRAMTKRISVYALSRERGSPYYNRWVQIWGSRILVAGSLDGKRRTYLIPSSIAVPGDSVAVWVQLGDDAVRTNWQTSMCGKIELRVRP